MARVHRPARTADRLRRALAAVSLLMVAGAGLAACDMPGGSEGTLRIVSGSENRSLEPLVLEFCEDEGWTCEMSYQGSVDIKLALAEGRIDFDAVWPAHSRWAEMGDTRRQVKHLRSILQSPIVFGVARPKAEELGLIGTDVSTDDIVDLVTAGRLPFIMTSATQSNSGFSAYLAMLVTMAGNPEVLTSEMLQDQEVRRKVGTLLDGVVRTSGSSGWLKNLYLEGAASGAYTTMVNYEAMVIEANQELADRGLPQLYVVYPSDGVAVADSPLGFVARENDPDQAKKEEFFLKLQAYLLSDPIQQELGNMGRRTGLGGVAGGADPDVWRAEWGLDVDRALRAVRFPAPTVIEEALALYQQTLRKPSLTALCLDFSGSMTGQGVSDLKTALTRLFDPEVARRYMLQATPQDIFIAIPFSSQPWESRVQEAQGPVAGVAMARYVQERLQPEGGTDIYACARYALELLANRPEIGTHNAAVVLMTDGESDGDPERFRRAYSDFGRDVPIYSITFGNAQEDQLEQVADWTRARVFDGRKNLEQAFRRARGYN